VSFTKFQEAELEAIKASLENHPVYKNINKAKDIASLMSYHVFAVWDFMSLLKSLQNEIASTNTPWLPSKYPKEIVRFINEIVLAEESDEDGEGGYCDHFTLYLKAMDEVGADYSKVLDFIDRKEVRKLPIEIYQFTKFNLDLVSEGSAHKVASAFFFGREDIIPMMFKAITKNTLNTSYKHPKLNYYLERHIELDENEHGPLARRIIEYLCQDDTKKWTEAYEVALKSLQLRKTLWDSVLNQIKENRPYLNNLDT